MAGPAVLSWAGLAGLLGGCGPAAQVSDQGCQLTSVGCRDGSTGAAMAAALETARPAASTPQGGGAALRSFHGSDPVLPTEGVGCSLCCLAGTAAELPVASFALALAMAVAFCNPCPCKLASSTWMTGMGEGWPSPGKLACVGAGSAIGSAGRVDVEAP